MCPDCKANQWLFGLWNNTQPAELCQSVLVLILIKNFQNIFQSGSSVLHSQINVWELHLIHIYFCYYGYLQCTMSFVCWLGTGHWRVFLSFGAPCSVVSCCCMAPHPRVPLSMPLPHRPAVKWHLYSMPNSYWRQKYSLVIPFQPWSLGFSLVSGPLTGNFLSFLPLLPLTAKLCFVHIWYWAAIPCLFPSCGDLCYRILFPK